MPEFFLAHVQLSAIFIELAHGRQVELACGQAQNAHVVDGKPAAILDGTIAEGIEAFALPAQLLDRVCSLSYLAQVPEQLDELLILSHPNVIAYTE